MMLFMGDNGRKYHKGGWAGQNSVRLDKTLRNWIGSMDEAQRKQFVNVLFQ